jgi:hypothetical protein
VSGFKDRDFNERRNTAAAARKAALEKFLAQPKPDDPAVLARQEERRKIAEARDIRAAERRAAKEAEAARLAAEAAARDLALQAELAAQAQRALEAAAREEAIKAERKAARDARYAARKARR